MSHDPEEIPLHDGPDPRRWRGRQDIWPLAEDLREADLMLELLDGKVARDGMPRAFEEARALLRAISEQCAARLAGALLDAYHVDLPEEDADAPTEAVGGIRGDGNRPGDRDHV